jgi:hypothetical protein
MVVRIRNFVRENEVWFIKNAYLCSGKLPFMRKRSLVKHFILFVVLFLCCQGARALSLSLDSIAEWGKFPRFCINTYRWGDRFFNTYDTTYVQGTGYKFNVKFTQDSWMDHYFFQLPNNTTVSMTSDPSTSVGVYATYLAVSVGYDINVSNLFSGVQNARSRYRFAFNCSLLSFESYFENNRVGTTLKQFGDLKGLDDDFGGVDIKTWGADLYYFFNHKKYSQAAAFSFSRIQRKSQGSFYAGLSYYGQNYDFDFNMLPEYMKSRLPEWWSNYHYKVRTHNYGVRLGYNYSWVFAKNWLFGTTISPTISLRRGFVNSDGNTTVSLYGRFGLSIVWNNGRWFAAGIGKIESAAVSDRKTMFIGSALSAQACVGYRFNLW